MTRGRQANHAYVATEDDQTALDVLTHAITRNWIDRPAVSRQAQLDPGNTRQLSSNGPADDDESTELDRRVLRIIAERRTRSREAQRTIGRSL